MTVWRTIESMARTALANAAKAPNHGAWLDAMADVPYGALAAALEEIDRLRADVAHRNEVIAAMTAASQRIIDHAGQSSERLRYLAGFMSARSTGAVTTATEAELLAKQAIRAAHPMGPGHLPGEKHDPRLRVAVIESPQTFTSGGDGVD